MFVLNITPNFMTEIYVVQTIQLQYPNLAEALIM